MDKNTESTIPTVSLTKEKLNPLRIESPIPINLVEPIKIEVNLTTKGEKANKTTMSPRPVILSKRNKEMNVRREIIMEEGKSDLNVFIIKIKGLNNHIVVEVTKMEEVSDLIVVINTKGANGHSVDSTKIPTSLVEEEAVILVTKSLSTVMIMTCQDPAEEETSQDHVTTMTVMLSNLADKIEAGKRDNSLLVHILTRTKVNSLLKTTPKRKTLVVTSIRNPETRGEGEMVSNEEGK